MSEAPNPSLTEDHTVVLRLSTEALFGVLQDVTLHPDRFKVGPLLDTYATNPSSVDQFDIVAVVDNLLPAARGAQRALSEILVRLDMLLAYASNIEKEANEDDRPSA